MNVAQIFNLPYRRFAIGPRNHVFMLGSHRSTSRNNSHNLKPIPRLDPSLREFRGGNRGAVKFHDHAAWQEFLCQKKFLERARQFSLHFAPIGHDGAAAHFDSMFYEAITASQSFQTGS
jgi:hypothetical protein